VQVQPGWDSDAARVLAVVGGLLDVADTTDGSSPQPLQAPAAALARRDEVLRGVRAVARDAAFGLVGKGPRSLAVAAAGLRDALCAVHEVGPGGPSWGHDPLGALSEVEERWALAANEVSAFEAYRSLPAGELSTDRLREMLAVAGALGEALPHLDRDLAARAPELMSPAASHAGAVGLLSDPARHDNLGWAASRVRLAVERTAGLPPAPLLAPGRPPLAPSASRSTVEATISLAGALGQHPRALHMAELHEIGRALQTGCLTAAVVLGRVDGSLTGAGSLRERAQQAAAALDPLVNLRARSLGVPRTAVLETARMLEQVLGDTARQEVGVGSAAALRAVRPVLAWLTVTPQLADAAARGALAAFDDGRVAVVGGRLRPPAQRNWVLGGAPARELLASCVGPASSALRATGRSAVLVHQLTSPRATGGAPPASTAGLPLQQLQAALARRRPLDVAPAQSPTAGPPRRAPRR